MGEFGPGVEEAPIGHASTRRIGWQDASAGLFVNRMTCAFCGVLNSSLDHRCTRCGRRLYAPEAPVTRSAAAPQLAYSAAPEPAPAVVLNAPAQGSLFQGRETAVREPLRVVQMPPRAAAPKAHSYKRPPTGNFQQQLAFPEAQGAMRVIDDKTVICNAPVALPLHRVTAAAFDACLVLIALGLVFIGVSFAGVQVGFDKAALPWIGLALVVTLTLYRLVWCLSDSDSLGMRWAGLRLLNFDGAEPERAERVRRLITSYISMAAAGLGLLWALVDEERLTWHDHMSKTFPTAGSRMR